MPSRERVGARIRTVRTQQNKTLRDVESASGFSSTHISEIERGRTSPTIGALIRIAHALQKDPSFFLENRELDEIVVTTPEDRPVAEAAQIRVQGEGIGVEALTSGVLGGRLHAFEMRLERGADGVVNGPSGDCFLFCLGGALEVVLPDGTLELELGTSLHGALPLGFRLRNLAEDAARLVLIHDPGAVQS